MSTRRLAVVLVFLLGLGLSMRAQAPPPDLSEVQRLQLQVLSQQIELAQLRAQQAQADFDKARTALTTLLQTLAQPGYDLDLQRLVYVPTPAATP